MASTCAVLIVIRRHSIQCKPTSSLSELPSSIRVYYTYFISSMTGAICLNGRDQVDQYKKEEKWQMQNNLKFM